MTAPKTWDLLGAFETCLAQIAVAGGYFTDAGDHVTREPQQIPQDSQEAVIAVVLENVRRAEAPGLKRVGRLANVLVVGKLAVTQTDAQQRLHELAEDIERSLDGQQAQFGAGAHFPVWQSTDFIPPAQGIPWIGVEIRYAAHVVTRPQP